MTPDSTRDALTWSEPVTAPRPTRPAHDRELPGRARIHLDRPVPFLCIYRRPLGAKRVAEEELVSTEAAYLTAFGEGLVHEDLEEFVRDTVAAFSPEFAGFLLLEIWAGPPTGGDGAPVVRIVEQPERAPRSTVEHLADSLRDVRVRGRELVVERVVCAVPAPPGLPPILDEGTLRRLGCALVGLELSSIVPEGLTDVASLPREEGEPIRHAIRRGLAEFLRAHTTGPVGRFVSLGPRCLDELVFEVDRALAAIDRSFDFVFQVTPVNARAAREAFFAAREERAPSFLYRPCPIEPDRVQRRLYELPIERVEDPVLEQIFLEKRDEIGRKLTTLRDVGSRRFLYGSLLLYDAVEPELLRAAESLLADIPPPPPRAAGTVPSERVAARAREQLEAYGRELGEMPSRVEVRDDVVGLSVSNGVVLVSDDAAIPADRVEGLLAHEVGTHVVTFLNGSEQRMRLLATGLVGYDELQEGLAVLAEHIVGGLDAARLRLLAGRVVGASAMVDGASFLDTYRLLACAGFTKGEAFSISLRLYRGGGLTKDAIYLRGLLFLLDYLRRGGELEALFVGKVGEQHLPVIQALHRHGARLAPRIMPLHMRGEAAKEKIARLRRGVRPQDLVAAEP